MPTTTTTTTDGRPIASYPAAPRAGLAAAPARRARLRGDHGEGVISAAIAVLVMAFLGALMWVGFQQMWETTETNTRDQVEQIGQ